VKFEIYRTFYIRGPSNNMYDCKISKFAFQRYATSYEEDAANEEKSDHRNLKQWKENASSKINRSPFR
jgi:hypothetical protein